jgi:hypothetical protein
MGRFFHPQNILLLEVTLTVINFFSSSCNKSDDFHTNANPINRPVNRPVNPIADQHERLVYYLKWQVDKENKILKASFNLPDGKSPNNIIEIFPTGRKQTKYLGLMATLPSILTTKE